MVAVIHCSNHNNNNEINIITSTEDDNTQERQKDYYNYFVKGEPAYEKKGDFFVKLRKVPKKYTEAQAKHLSDLIKAYEALERMIPAKTKEELERLSRTDRNIETGRMNFKEKLLETYEVMSSMVEDLSKDRELEIKLSFFLSVTKENKINGTFSIRSDCLGHFQKTMQGNARPDSFEESGFIINLRPFKDEVKDNPKDCLKKTYEDARKVYACFDKIEQKCKEINPKEKNRVETKVRRKLEQKCEKTKKTSPKEENRVETEVMKKQSDEKKRIEKTKKSFEQVNAEINTDLDLLKMRIEKLGKYSKQKRESKNKNQKDKHID